MLTTKIRRLVCAAMVAALAACGSAPVGPGYYRVERGDTLYKIARSNRTSVESLTRWNKLSNPDSLEVGQVLRVAPPPGTATASTGSTRSSSSGSASAGASASASSSSRSAAADTPAAPASSISLIWPATGNVVRGFDGNNSKGIDIANAAGTPVFAAASGTVVYASNGLRGYGNLLIIKHNADYLTAYAHNRSLLVKEGETVQQGQKIAEMGDSDNDRVMLHFELRYAGRSIDPARSLPPR
ncbi:MULTISPECIES: peptidoglycan DD-metalloendopeptidase family protein [Paraburkholderia]|uniref:peptidoglycan DD-metalloendopeptidase family protein n=1 Tax=Paraburkholderia TaxID=1822464 RepID=UPI0015D9EFDE|nr:MULTISPECIES: peptidoglycan DD-metalloendopeptidase family protein [Paraburkholderia]BEU20829.1 peptidoglycan DD-metalloendopeptidase family protein [Paraburkholderia sp. 22B1P]GJH06794.1 peptidoglycan DD-metalloendopeptidase family protein [Paraburkholderia terrae]